MEINPQAPLVARKEISIQAPIELVWKLQTDVDAWKEWQPGISKSKIYGDIATGSVFEWINNLKLKAEALSASASLPRTTER